MLCRMFVLVVHIQPSKHVADRSDRSDRSALNGQNYVDHAIYLQARDVPAVNYR